MPFRKRKYHSPINLIIALANYSSGEPDPNAEPSTRLSCSIPQLADPPKNSRSLENRSCGMRGLL